MGAWFSRCCRCRDRRKNSTASTEFDPATHLEIRPLDKSGIDNPAIDVDQRTSIENENVERPQQNGDAMHDRLDSISLDDHPDFLSPDDKQQTDSMRVESGSRATTSEGLPIDPNVSEDSVFDDMDNEKMTALNSSPSLHATAIEDDLGELSPGCGATLTDVVLHDIAEEEELDKETRVDKESPLPTDGPLPMCVKVADLTSSSSEDEEEKEEEDRDRCWSFDSERELITRPGEEDDLSLDLTNLSSAEQVYDEVVRRLSTTQVIRTPQQPIVKSQAPLIHLRPMSVDIDECPKQRSSLRMMITEIDIGEPKVAMTNGQAVREEEEE